MTTSTLADQAYAALRRAILDGGLARGQKITERGLAELLNTSPTPVREAMRRLEQDRLVERRGPRAVRVADLDDAEIVDISTIENTLRALAARLAANRATESQLQRMTEALHAAEVERSALMGTDEPDIEAVRVGVDNIWLHLRTFHQLLDEACGSPMLLHMLRMADAFDSGERRSVLRSEILTDPGVAETRYRQHRAILDAVKARDAALAEKLMRDHGDDAVIPRLRSRTT